MGRDFIKSSPRFRDIRAANAPLVALCIAAGASAALSGLYASTAWIPAGLVLAAALIVTITSRPLRLTGPAVVGMAGLLGIGIWASASRLWAESVQRAAVDGNRWMVVAMTLVLALGLITSRRSGRIAVLALGTGIGAVAAYVLVRIFVSEPSAVFLGGRLNEPLGYINGQACLFVMGFWVAVSVAERPAPLVAGLGAAAAALFGSLVVLSQSRGAVLAAAASIVVVVGVVPGRLRRIVALSAIAAGVFSASIWLLDVYVVAQAGPLTTETTRAAAAGVVLSMVVAGGLWGGAMHTMRRLGPRAAAARRLGLFGLRVACAMAAVVAISLAGRIADGAKDQYDGFSHVDTTTPNAPQSDTGSRLTSMSGSRYDFWRVALETWRAHPAEGVGAGNYPASYYLRRATNEDIRQPHSLVLQVLSELGAIGVGLLALFVAGFAWGATRLIRSAASAPSASELAVAGIGAATTWFLQTSIDWIHLLPGVTAVALILAAAVMSPDAPDDRALTLGLARRRRSGQLSVVVTALFLGVFGLAGASLARQGLADHYRSKARTALARDPAEALRQADRSLGIDSSSVDTYYLKAAALARFNRADGSAAVLRQALRREPANFVTWTLMGDLAVRRGDLAGARASYRRAFALNPRDVGLGNLARNPALVLADNG